MADEPMVTQSDPLLQQSDDLQLVEMEVGPGQLYVGHARMQLVRIGTGILSTLQSRYEGDFLDDTCHGYGQYTILKTGNVFIGAFVNGKRHGPGQVQVANSARYQVRYDLDKCLESRLLADDEELDEDVAKIVWKARTQGELARASRARYHEQNHPSHIPKQLSGNANWLDAGAGEGVEDEGSSAQSNKQRFRNSLPAIPTNGHVRHNSEGNQPNEEMRMMKERLEELSLLVAGMQGEWAGASNPKRQGEVEGQITQLRSDLERSNETASNMKAAVTFLQAKLSHMPDTDLWRCVGTLQGHDGPVWALAVRHNYVFSSSSDKTIRVWNHSTLRSNYILQGHENTILCLLTVKKYLFSCANDMKIAVWDIEDDCKLVYMVQPSEKPQISLAFENGMLFSGSFKEIRVWELTEKGDQKIRIKKVLPAHNHWVRAMTTTPTQLISGSYGQVWVWSLETFDCVRKISCGGGSVYSIAIADGYLCCGTYEKYIHLFNMTTWEKKYTLDKHTSAVYCLAVMPGSVDYLFSGSYDNTICVWNPTTGHLIQMLDRHNSSVNALVFLKGRMYSGAADKTVRLWEQLSVGSQLETTTPNAPPRTPQPS